jgi:hypothetical protein
LLHSLSLHQLAVQAATGAKRDISFQALIALQQQLSMNAHTSDESMFNSRLSRVVTKLFSRVIKAEEGDAKPFELDHFDTESIICSLEDSLVACSQAEQGGETADAAAASRNLATMLVKAMLKARGESFSLRGELDELGIDSTSSDLGKLLVSSATELGLYSGSPRGPPRGGVSNRDVSALVSAVGSASQGAEREKAISALKRYKEIYGDVDLIEHLEQVSATFREFILEQLSVNNAAAAPAAIGSDSMSERIKNLRSKLNSAETSGQSAVSTTSENPSEANATNQDSISTLLQPTSSEAGQVESAPTVRAFRARLAAAQGKRSTSTSSNAEASPMVSDSAGSRAAALRARLQKVKDQSMG